MLTCVTSAWGESKISLEAPQDLLELVFQLCGQQRLSRRVQPTSTAITMVTDASLEPHKATALNKKPKIKQKTVLL